jgi:hypothetical protein
MGRDNLWDGIGMDGFRYMDHLPDFIRAGQNQQLTNEKPKSPQEGPFLSKNGTMGLEKLKKVL